MKPCMHNICIIIDKSLEIHKNLFHTRNSADFFVLEKTEIWRTEALPGDKN